MTQEFSTMPIADQLAASFVPAGMRRQFLRDPSRKVGTPIGEGFAALLWIDICAFSPLCNRVIKDRSMGVEKLSGILQEHYEMLLDIISSYNGEPVIFAGDGIMAAWPCHADMLKSAIESAAACAHSILKNRSTCDDLGNLLSFHLVVAGGPCEIIEIGGYNSRWLYSLTGSTLSEVSVTSRNRAPDHVLISNATLAYLDENLKRTAVEHNSSILLESPVIDLPVIEEPEVLSQEAINTLIWFVPKPIGYPLSRERLQWVAELRPVTIVFVQIPIHNLGSADTINSLKQSVSLTMPLVFKYDGLINQVWVDEKDGNMLICFGPPPHSHSNNPERGVKIAIDIHEVLNKAGFENSIGISTGHAYCGILGNDMLRQYTVIGDVVNLGARFAGLKKNQILCDTTTYNLCQGVIEFSEPENVLIKGQAGEVSVWTPLKALSNDSAYQLNPVSIGRQKELLYLLDNFDTIAASGKSQLMVIQGLSGMGKSRLLLDFKICLKGTEKMALIETTDVREKEIPYHAWRYIFATLLSAQDGKDDINRIALAESLVEKYGYRASLLNVVLKLAIPDAAEIQALSSSQRVAATHKFLLEILDEATKEQALAFIIDDAQWIDEMSANLVAAVPVHVSRCLMICALPDAGGVPMVQNLLDSGAIDLSLNELSDKDLNHIICSKLGVLEISEEISAPIRKVAKGNPFFCTQLAGSMLDQGLIIVENNKCHFAENFNSEMLSLPETVKGVVRRRIDCLGVGAQLALKVGSVIGQRFRTSLIQHIYPIQLEKNLVSSYLLEDKQFGMLHETIVENMDGFLFNHGVTREVAYEMTLMEQRKHLHRKSAEWYESNFSEDLSPFFTHLAHHWEQTGELIKASEYYEREAFRLFSLGYPRQATDVGLKGIALFDVVIDMDRAAMGMKIGENMGVIGELMANKTIEGLLELKTLDDPRTSRLITMLTHISPLAHNSGQVELFVLLSLIGLRITLENGNNESTSDVYSMYSILYRSMTGDSPTADRWSKLSMDADNKFGGVLHGRVAFVRTWFISHWVRHMKESLTISAGCIDAAFQGGDVMFGCFNLSCYVVLLARTGTPLNKVIEVGREYFGRNNRRVANAAFHLFDEIQRAKALAGLTNSPTSLTDDEFNEERDIATICNTDFANQIACYFISKLMLHVHFGEWNEALVWAEKIPPFFMAFAGQPGEIDFEFNNCIVSLYKSSELTGDAAEKLLQTAEAGINKMKGWVQFCEANFLNKVLILEAIREGFLGTAGNATKMFIHAAGKAAEYGYIQDVALAHEHLLRMQHRLGLPKDSLVDAVAAYNVWGADAKVKYLNENFS